MPLSGGNVRPATHDELLAALHAGLAGVFELPAGRPSIELGEAYPAVAHLRIDITDAVVRPDYRPASFAESGRPTFTAARFDVVGRPLHYGRADIQFDLHARDAALELTQDAEGRGVLLPVAAAHGRLDLRLTHADLQAAARTLAETAAADYGVAISDTDVQLTCAGERSVSVAARATASKDVLFTAVRAAVRARGRLTLDDALNATLSGLACEGDGIVGAMVAGLLEHELKDWEGQTFPLASFALGRLRLHDLRIHCEDGLHVEAAFGG